MQGFPATILHYLNYMHELKGESKALGEHHEGVKIIIVLDKTIFYPQGGGQPFDTGTIIGKDAEFQVNEVRHAEGEVVNHIGTFTKGEKFTLGETVQIELVRIVVVWGEKGCPCGGTHVKNISEIGSITIPKIKVSKDEIRVSYRV